MTALSHARPAPVQATQDGVPARALARPIVPVILSGGSGTRLWPLSREGYPKQFLNLMGTTSPLQETLLRVADPELYLPPIVVCAHEHRFVVAEQARLMGIDLAAIITEPTPRNTAPAIAAAALYAARAHEDASILVMPADHKIVYNDKLQTAFMTAGAVPSADHFVIFGAKAIGPATGYGYIHRGASSDQADHVYAVRGFVEKPNAEKAAAYVASGDYDWNCGIFMLPIRAFLQEMKDLAPAILDGAAAALDKGKEDNNFLHLDKDSFSACPSISIDYAIMEKTQRALVVPMDCGWSDLGAWPSIWDASDKDDHGNAIIGDGLAHASRNCLIHSPTKLTALLGVENLAVITTEDAVLVASMDKAQDIRAIVDALKAKDRPEATIPFRVHRPWGWYEGIARGERFQVKHIFVRPGQSLSLQMHYHRAEHWVVVAGSAEIECDDTKKFVRTNESVFIPQGSTHRLTNPGRIDLHLIEVQSGDYLGEDDIVRFADVFGRA